MAPTDAGGSAVEPLPAFPDPDFPAEIREIMRKLRFSRQEVRDFASCCRRRNKSVHPLSKFRDHAQIALLMSGDADTLRDVLPCPQRFRQQRLPPAIGDQAAAIGAPREP